MGKNGKIRGKWPRIRITGGAYVMGALWLLTVPLPWVCAAVLAGTAHELGHLAVLRLLRVPVWGITVGAFGARIEAAPMEPGQQALSSLAGPAAGLAVWALGRRLPRTAVCALVQSLFNLLPLGTLDGAGALKSLRETRLKRFHMENSVANAPVWGYNDSD